VQKPYVHKQNDHHVLQTHVFQLFWARAISTAYVRKGFVNLGVPVLSPCSSFRDLQTPYANEQITVFMIQSEAALELRNLQKPSVHKQTLVFLHHCKNVDKASKSTDTICK
jgi:hypothetical protein